MYSWSSTLRPLCGAYNVEIGGREIFLFKRLRLFWNNVERTTVCEPIYAKVAIQSKHVPITQCFRYRYE